MTVSFASGDRSSSATFNALALNSFTISAPLEDAGVARRAP
jgi:hypothetical protein